MGGGQARRRHDLLDPARRHARRGLRDRGPEAGRRRVLRRRRQQLARRPHQPQPVVRAPHQRLLAQRGEGARQRVHDRGIAPVARHQREQLVVRRRVRRDGQCLRRLQRETVEALEGAHDRPAGTGPGRELGEVGGDGRDEVGAAAQQRGKGGVVPGSEGLRERTGRRGRGAHPTHGSGYGPRAGVLRPEVSTPRRPACARYPPAGERPMGGRRSPAPGQGGDDRPLPGNRRSPARLRRPPSPRLGPLRGRSRPPQGTGATISPRRPEKPRPPAMAAVSPAGTPTRPTPPPHPGTAATIAPCPAAGKAPPACHGRRLPGWGPYAVDASRTRARRQRSSPRPPSTPRLTDVDHLPSDPSAAGTRPHPDPPCAPDARPTGVPTCATVVAAGYPTHPPRRDFVGIESDQVVYEYLSRVGDVAQQRQLPSVTRMRLVSELRNEIDRRRAGATVDTPGQSSASSRASAPRTRSSPRLRHRRRCPPGSDALRPRTTRPRGRSTAEGAAPGRTAAAYPPHQSRARCRARRRPLRAASRERVRAGRERAAAGLVAGGERQRVRARRQRARVHRRDRDPRTPQAPAAEGDPEGAKRRHRRPWSLR